MTQSDATRSNRYEFVLAVAHRDLGAGDGFDAGRLRLIWRVSIGDFRGRFRRRKAQFLVIDLPQYSPQLRVLRLNGAGEAYGLILEFDGVRRNLRLGRR